MHLLQFHRQGTQPSKHNMAPYALFALITFLIPAGAEVDRLEPREEDLEYPGTNVKEAGQVQTLWNIYYECLKDQAEAHHSARKPIIRRITEGQYTQLVCAICRRPFQGWEAMQWKYKTMQSPDEATDLAVQEHMVDKDGRLEIYNARIEDAGLYVCQHGLYVVSVYLLEVSRHDPYTMVWQPRIEDRPHSSPPRQVPGTRLEVYTRWDTWSECSTCDAAGTRHRYGTCMVGVTEGNQSRSHVAEATVGKFQSGIPCYSPLLPGRDEIVAGRTNELLIELCKVPCYQIFKATSKKGKLLELVNNTAGVFSAFQTLPTAGPGVERTMVEGISLEPVILRCPSNLHINAPTRWMFNKVPLDALQGRVTTDIHQRVVILQLHHSDTGFYSCWKGKELAGVVTLYVRTPLQLSTWDPLLMALLTAAIVVTFFRVGMAVFMRYRANRIDPAWG